MRRGVLTALLIACLTGPPAAAGVLDNFKDPEELKLSVMRYDEIFGGDFDYWNAHIRAGHAWGR